jgi:methylenetetrahydrofolate dehydrogenase (NADP+)/methenyltetrahydrofolate cyclohydrolase
VSPARATHLAIMPATIIDGKKIAAELQLALRGEAARLRAAGVTPSLAVVLVGEDPASQIYVRGKKRVAQDLGIEARDYLLPAAIPQSELLHLIEQLNADPSVHGILVQTPLPAGIDERAVLEQVAAAKDVDGLHPLNLGKLVVGPIAMPPCTPAGVMELFRRTGVTLVGKEAVMVGRSELVGKPLALLMLHEHATVTLCHSRTRDLPAVCRRAEVLVVAVGRPALITAEYLRPGAVVIDVGMNRLPDRLVGDVDFEAARAIAGAITPVPGGVGPMTITMLMKNTLTAARQQSGTTGVDP